VLLVSGKMWALWRGEPLLSQHAHTVWKIREGFTKDSIYAIAQTPDKSASRDRLQRHTRCFGVFRSE
jgi:hypothetical protein